MSVIEMALFLLASIYISNSEDNSPESLFLLTCSPRVFVPLSRYSFPSSHWPIPPPRPSRVDWFSPPPPHYILHMQVGVIKVRGNANTHSLEAEFPDLEQNVSDGPEKREKCFVSSVVCRLGIRTNTFIAYRCRNRSSDSSCIYNPTTDNTSITAHLQVSTHAVNMKHETHKILSSVAHRN
ncbi:hypothetical protein QBC38DRAFT_129351 [Podospora fimiseda]|uniref:Secreted protein n=1 Tax=Podospora fimiseda TaxID=252190 RepID=A0AAN7H1E1_9PEZI|nr:hypothetical protein QBC38DRAFT_129351 [Podospora fimiseda]